MIRVIGILGAFAISLLIAVILPLWADETSVFPLDLGRTWSYIGDKGHPAEIWIDGSRELFGSQVMIRRESLGDSTGSQELENYWSETQEGGTLLHGFTNFTHEFTGLHVPPILYLDPPLELGKTWSTTFRTYPNLDGTGNPTIEVILTFEVTSEQEMTVPAGTFYAYDVIYRVDVPTSPSKAEDIAGVLDLLGYGSSPESVQAYDDPESYAPGVGLIRFAVAETYELASYGGPVQAQDMTWGRIKAGYRHDRQ